MVNFLFGSVCQPKINEYDGDDSLNFLHIATIANNAQQITNQIIVVAVATTGGISGNSCSSSCAVA